MLIVPRKDHGVLSCCTLMLALGADYSAAAAEAAVQSEARAEQLAKTRNPLADLISVPLYQCIVAEPSSVLDEFVQQRITTNVTITHGMLIASCTGIGLRLYFHLARIGSFKNFPWLV